MSKTIWKYSAEPGDEFAPRMPKGSEVIHVHGQGQFICIWALGDPLAELERREFHVYGTGHAVSHNPGNYIGTAHTCDGRFVWHVFEVQP